MSGRSYASGLLEMTNPSGNTAAYPQGDSRLWILEKLERKLVWHETNGYSIDTNKTEWVDFWGVAVYL